MIDIYVLADGNKKFPRTSWQRAISGEMKLKTLWHRYDNLSEIQQEIAFTEFDFYQRYAETFKTSEFFHIPILCKTCNWVNILDTISSF